MINFDSFENFLEEFKKDKIKFYANLFIDESNLDLSLEIDENILFKIKSKNDEYRISGILIIILVLCI